VKSVKQDDFDKKIKELNKVYGKLRKKRYNFVCGLHAYGLLVALLRE